MMGMMESDEWFEIHWQQGADYELIEKRGRFLARNTILPYSTLRITSPLMVNSVVNVEVCLDRKRFPSHKKIYERKNYREGT